MAMALFGFSVLLTRFFISFKDNSLPLRRVWQSIAFMTPSSSRMLVSMVDTRYPIASSFRVMEFWFSLALIMAILDSWSGAGISTIMPAAKRDFSLSSRFWMKLGCLSDEKIICLFWS